jgi:hypothetical protein
MEKQAFIVMVTTEMGITALMLYFFLKVIFSKPKAEPDSYTED